MHISTPIVYFFYNRYDTVVAQMDAVKSINFLKVYIFLDGPKNENDKIIQCKIKELISGAITTNELILIERDINLGCKRSVSQGITLVLEENERAIFLEDDCIPNDGTFLFFETALEEYAGHDHIKMICGSNLLAHTQYNSEISLSATINCWGWAGWRNKTKAICNFDIYADDIKSMLSHSENFQSLPYFRRLYWKCIFYNSINSNTIWDFYLQLNLFHLNGYSLVPSSNLVKNIGFSEDATHTKFQHPPIYVQKNEPVNLNEVKHWSYEQNLSVDKVRELQILPTLYEYTILRLIKLCIGTVLRTLGRLYSLAR